MTPPFVASDTSKQAAEAAVPLVQSDEETILALLRRRPMTDDAIEEATGLSHQTASARRNGLVAKGLVEDSGRKALTRSGRNAVVWRLVAEPRPMTALARRVRRPPPEALIAASLALVTFGGDSDECRDVAAWLTKIANTSVDVTGDRKQ